MYLKNLALLQKKILTRNPHYMLLLRFNQKSALTKLALRSKRYKQQLKVKLTMRGSQSFNLYTIYYGNIKKQLFIKQSQ